MVVVAHVFVVAGIVGYFGISKTLEMVYLRCIQDCAAGGKVRAGAGAGGS